MTKIAGKQINRLLSGYLRLSGFTANGSSNNITSTLTSFLATAGYNSVALAVVPSAGPGVAGIATTSPINRVEIFDDNNKNKLTDTSEEIYGRITEASGVFTLSYYYQDSNGLETIHNFPVATVIDIEFVYRFQFGELPTDAFIAVIARNVVMDPQGGGTSGALFIEQLNVTSTDTVANLTYQPSIIANVFLFINGKQESTLGITPSFGMSGKQVNWNFANAGYHIATTDLVVVQYTTHDI